MNRLSKCIANHNKSAETYIKYLESTNNNIAFTIKAYNTFPTVFESPVINGFDICWSGFSSFFNISFYGSYNVKYEDAENFICDLAELWDFAPKLLIGSEGYIQFVSHKPFTLLDKPANVILYGSNDNGGKFMQQRKTEWIERVETSYICRT